MVVVVVNMFRRLFISYYKKNDDRIREMKNEKAHILTIWTTEKYLF